MFPSSYHLSQQLWDILSLSYLLPLPIPCAFAIIPSCSLSLRPGVSCGMRPAKALFAAHDTLFEILKNLEKNVVLFILQHVSSSNPAKLLFFSLVLAATNVDSRQSVSVLPFLAVSVQGHPKAPPATQNASQKSSCGK